MGYEIEVKYRAGDRAGLERRLSDLGATAAAGAGVEQEDIYLAHPTRDFARSDEAFRLRREGGRNRITYKGPKQGGPTKTREEIEIPFADGPEDLAGLLKIFERLGFRQVATVRKVRTSYRLVRGGRPIEVAVDVAEGLGTFAEVEALAGPDEMAGAQSAVLALARELGLDDVEPRSYLRMALERRGAGPVNPAGQT